MNEAKPVSAERSGIYYKWLKELKDPRARARIIVRTNHSMKKSSCCYVVVISTDSRQTLKRQNE